MEFVQPLWRGVRSFEASTRVIADVRVATPARAPARIATTVVIGRGCNGDIRTAVSPVIVVGTGGVTVGNIGAGIIGVGGIVRRAIAIAVAIHVGPATGRAKEGAGCEAARPGRAPPPPSAAPAPLGIRGG